MSEVLKTLLVKSSNNIGMKVFAQCILILVMVEDNLSIKLLEVLRLGVPVGGQG